MLKGKLEWDQEVPQEMANQWHRLVTDFHTYIIWQFNRKITTAYQVEMRIFSDVSNVPYGTTANFCTRENSNLIMAMAKVASIKQVTIRKSELTTGLLTARLTKSIQGTYEGILTITNTYLWCDNQITLQWLHSQEVVPVYVANSVDEIESLTPHVSLRYIATQDNTADLITRDITAKIITWILGVVEWMILAHHSKTVV